VPISPINHNNEFFAMGFKLVVSKDMNNAMAKGKKNRQSGIWHPSV
jgi:hypothetical protein